MQKSKKKTVMHWLSVCTRLAAMIYLKRHNNMPMILCVTLRIQERLLGKMQNGIKKGRTMDLSQRMMNVGYRILSFKRPGRLYFF